MMKTIFFTISLFIFTCSASAFVTPDSIGAYKDGNQTFVIYEVNKGETLYSLSKKYNVAVETIIAANPAITDYTISEGQIIKIPSRSSSVAVKPAAPVNTTPAAASSEKMIKHVIQSGETLSGIAFKYKVRMADIMEWNNLSDANIKSGYTLIIYPNNEVAEAQPVVKPQPKPEQRITTFEPRVEPSETKRSEPVKVTEPAPVKVVETPKPVQVQEPVQQPVIKRTNGNIEHTVQQGETLYSISKKYDVRVTEIMDWNQLTALEIRSGQVLVIYPRSENVKISVEQENNNPKQKEPDHIVFENAPKPVMEGVKEEKKEKEPKVRPARDFEARESVLSLKYKEDASSTYYKEASENGIATWISDASPAASKNGYFALHKTLPVGTVIKVKNMVNNRIVYARVIGNLPDTQDNQNFSLKLPATAAREMNALDERVAVQITYLKPAKEF